jgi:CRP/FNR family transcriptional regulator
MLDFHQIAGRDCADILEREGREINAPAGTRLFQPGKDCAQFLIVTEGKVRVQMVADNGREIVLYRVHPGETCMLTTSCLLSQSAYRAEGIAETDIRAQVLNASAFRALLDRSSAFRNFVFSTYSTRFSDLILLIEEVVFRRVDIRLATHLLRLASTEGIVASTHQELAVELGSAREVISRQLKEFERRGWVRLSRGHITLIKQTQLHGLAGE